MTLPRAALLAAIGVLLRASSYWVANLIPSWGVASGYVKFLLMEVAVIDPLIWCFYFGSLWLGRGIRIAALAAALLGVLEIGAAAFRQYSVLSWMSLDSIVFVLGAVVPVFCWTLFLLHQAGWRAKPRVALWYLLLFALSQVAYYVYQITGSWPQIREFWRYEPWILLAVPSIWLFYWLTQALFVRAAQRPT